MFYPVQESAKEIRVTMAQRDTAMIGAHSYHTYHVISFQETCRDGQQGGGTIIVIAIPPQNSLGATFCGH